MPTLSLVVDLNECCSFDTDDVNYQVHPFCVMEKDIKGDNIKRQKEVSQSSESTDLIEFAERLKANILIVSEGGKMAHCVWKTLA